MRAFDFLEPETLDEALQMLAFHGDAACVFGGGSALLLGMRQNIVSPRIVVSLGRIGALRGIAFDPRQGLRIGAMSRHCDIAASAVVQQHYPMLARVAGALANPQVRNQGTIGGNLCYGDPSTDPPAALMALGAQLGLAGRSGTRRLPLEAFLVDFFTTALEPGEVVTDIHLPPPLPDSACYYRRHLRTPAEHRPVVNAALHLRRDGTQWQDVRLVLGAALPVARRLPRAEALLTGQPITLKLAQQVARIAEDDCTPISDGRADAAFRRRILGATLRRLVAEAAALDWTEDPR